MDKTTIDRVGSGVEYTSGGGCSALGIAGLGDAGAFASSSSAWLFHLAMKLGRCFSTLENDIRADGLR